MKIIRDEMPDLIPYEENYESFEYLKREAIEADKYDYDIEIEEDESYD